MSKQPKVDKFDPITLHIEGRRGDFEFHTWTKTAKAGVCAELHKDSKVFTVARSKLRSRQADLIAAGGRDHDALDAGAARPMARAAER